MRFFCPPRRGRSQPCKDLGGEPSKWKEQLCRGRKTFHDENGVWGRLVPGKAVESQGAGCGMTAVDTGKRMGFAFSGLVNSSVMVLVAVRRPEWSRAGAGGLPDGIGRGS